MSSASLSEFIENNPKTNIARIIIDLMSENYAKTAERQVCNVLWRFGGVKKPEKTFPVFVLFFFLIGKESLKLLAWGGVGVDIIWVYLGHKHVVAKMAILPLILFIHIHSSCQFFFLLFI